MDRNILKSVVLGNQYEIEKIELFDKMPENLTYPDTHKLLFKEVLKTIEKNKK